MNRAAAMAVMKNTAASAPSSSAPVNFQRTDGSSGAFSSHCRISVIFRLAATPGAALAWMTTRRWPSRRWIEVTCWPGVCLIR